MASGKPALERTVLEVRTKHARIEVRKAVRA
jgi:hypothetical protein